MKRNVVELSKRSTVVRDLHSSKYRQRVVQSKGRRKRNNDEEIQDGDDLDFNDVDLDDLDDSLFESD